MDARGDAFGPRPGTAGVDPAEFAAAGEHFGGGDVPAAGEGVGFYVAHGGGLVGCVGDGWRVGEWRDGG